MDYPADPQHPHEDLIDALRGGLKLMIVDRPSNQSGFTRTRAGRVF
jgi:hypothetical protein